MIRVEELGLRVYRLEVGDERLGSLLLVLILGHKEDSGVL